VARVDCILVANWTPADGNIAAGDNRTSTTVVACPLAFESAKGAPLDIVTTVTCDQPGTIAVYQGTRVQDFAGLPAAPPAGTLVHVAGPFPVVANTPLSTIVAFQAPVIAVQWLNGINIATVLRLWAGIRYR